MAIRIVSIVLATLACLCLSRGVQNSAGESGARAWELKNQFPSSEQRALANTFFASNPILSAPRPVLNKVGRVADPGMFTGGRKASPKKVAPKKVVRASSPKKVAPKKVVPRRRSGGLAEANAAKGRKNNIDNDGLSVQVSPFQPAFDEVGVLPPLGRWDPLKIREQGPERYRRFVEMEIKHGRLAMAAFVGILVTLAGIRFPGEVAAGVKFADIPGSALTSWAALPKGAWLSVLASISLAEVSFFKQDPNKDAGDVVPDGFLWARYPDGYDLWLGDGTVKKVGEEDLFVGKTWKLNAERNNGRAAMMAVIGIIVHEIITGQPLYPLLIEDSATITTLR